MVKPVTFGNFVRGVDASAGVLAQPRGTIPRGSNLILTKRGSLHTCDGSQVVHAFQGALQSAQGRCMAAFLFKPTGVASYYLALFKGPDVFNRLGAPQNLTSALAGGGTLTSGTTYFYKVTALDGIGGETNASNETSATPAGGNLSVALTWNVVPNAVQYNVYRSTTTGAEILIVGAGLPVSQVAPGNLTVSFTDTGAATSSSLTATADSWTTGAGFGGQQTTVIINVPSVTGLAIGQTVTLSAFAAGFINGSRSIASIISGPKPSFTVIISGSNGSGSGAGGTVAFAAPPSVDNTAPSLLFQMPVIQGSNATLPVSYNRPNIVGVFPADNVLTIEGGGGGGPGGGGGTGGGGSGGGAGGGASPTPSGGIPNNVSPLPQFVQFTNQAVIALGNGFPVQVFSDASGTLVNPATVAAISTISVDAFGVVTVTTSTPHGLTSAQVGANVVLAGVTNTLYTNGFSSAAYTTIQIVSPTVYKVRNLLAIGQAASSGGTSTTSTIPLTSSFLPAFPTWTAAVAYSVNSIVQPTPNTNNIFFKAIQGGTSGGAQPGAFTTQTAADKGKQVADNNIIWVNQGSTNSTAPPPPAAAHITVYSGSLWAWDTSPTNTATGLDGPTSLRMSDVNNLGSWNPVNQAFLDKDDGTEGMGLTAFTITAQGIPPVGSLAVFKNFSTYMIAGVFGSANFSIQRALTDMGCNAPRTIQFVPGFGIARYTHLGVGVFDAVNDRIISEQMRPYLFPTNDADVSDITVADSNAIALSWATQTANPPGFAILIPIGVSNGALQRILFFDLVLKGWGAPVDLPFLASFIGQFRTVSANPVTIIGGFNDGALSRWQAGDQLWDVGGTVARTPSQVAWNARTPTVSSKDPDNRLYCRRVVVRGYVDNSPPSTITIQPRVAGVAQAAQTVPVLATGDVMKQAAVGITHDRFDAIVSGQGQITIDAFDFHVVPKPIGVLAGPVC